MPYKPKSWNVEISTLPRDVRLVLGPWRSCRRIPVSRGTFRYDVTITKKHPHAVGGLEREAVHRSSTPMDVGQNQPSQEKGTCALKGMDPQRRNRVLESLVVFWCFLFGAHARVSREAISPEPSWRCTPLCTPITDSFLYPVQKIQNAQLASAGHVMRRHQPLLSTLMTATISDHKAYSNKFNHTVYNIIYWWSFLTAIH